MPKVAKTETWNAPIASCFRAITDYQSYPDFVEGISGGGFSPRMKGAPGGVPSQPDQEV